MRVLNTAYDAVRRTSSIKGDLKHQMIVRMETARAAVQKLTARDGLAASSPPVVVGGAGEGDEEARLGSLERDLRREIADRDAIVAGLRAENAALRGDVTSLSEELRSLRERFSRSAGGSSPGGARVERDVVAPPLSVVDARRRDVGAGGSGPSRVRGSRGGGDSRLDRRDFPVLPSAWRPPIRGVSVRLPDSGETGRGYGFGDRCDDAMDSRGARDVRVSASRGASASGRSRGAWPHDGGASGGRGGRARGARGRAGWDSDGYPAQESGLSGGESSRRERWGPGGSRVAGVVFGAPSGDARVFADGVYAGRAGASRSGYEEASSPRPARPSDPPRSRVGGGIPASRRRLARTPIVVVECAEGGPSYAETLRRAKERIRLEDIGIDDVRVARAMADSLAIRVLGDPTRGNSFVCKFVFSMNARTRSPSDSCAVAR